MSLGVPMLDTLGHLRFFAAMTGSFGYRMFQRGISIGDFPLHQTWLNGTGLLGVGFVLPGREVSRQP